jgi:membrane protein required for colicin V production
MQGADYIIVGIIGFSVICGAVRGFVREVAALLAWVIGIWVAWRFSGFLYPYLGGVLDEPTQKAWAARVIVLFIVLVVGNLIGMLLAWIMHTAAGLGLMDRGLGALFGFCRAAVMIGFLVIVGHALELDGEPWWTHARLMGYAESVGHWVEKVSGHHPEVRHRFELPSLPGEH